MESISSAGVTSDSRVPAPIGRLSVIFAVAGGILFGTLLVCATWPENLGLRIVLVTLIVGLGLWPIIGTFPGLLEKCTLFGLAFTLSISLKFHPLYRSDHLGGSIGLRVSITDLLLILLVSSALWRRQRGERVRIEIDRSIFVVFCLYMGFAGLSALLGADKNLGLFQWIAYGQSFTAAVLLANYLMNAERLRIFLAGLLLALCLQSGVTILQTERPGALPLQFLGASDQAAEDVTDDPVLPEVDIGTTTVGGEIQQRPSGLLIHPNVLGFYLVLMIPVAFGVWLGFDNIGLRALALASTGLSVVALYLSLSRAGWAGAAFAAFVAMCALEPWRLRLRRSQKLILGIMIMAFGVGVVVGAGRVYTRVVETADEAIEFRQNLANTALGMMADHPLFGVGLNSFIETSDSYDVSGEGRLKKFPVHNVFLLEASEIGIPGGIAFLILVLTMVWRTMSKARGCPAHGMRIFAVLSASGIAGFWFAQISDFVYRIPILTTILWVHVALVYAAVSVGEMEG